ncbi:MAG: hypothetical protein MZV65_36325 [Chromatiales bacterium]|nr:hypothetical protein [Chromatiales bacterium]
MAETIENNVRKLIINESPVDPAYYEKMSKLLDALIEQRRQGCDRLPAIPGQDRRVDEAGHATRAAARAILPAMNTPAKRALYNNLGKDEALALAVDRAVQTAGRTVGVTTR